MDPSNGEGRTAHVTFEFSEVVESPIDTAEFAVAFQSTSFLGVDANPMGEILFGTLEANAAWKES